MKLLLISIACLASLLLITAENTAKKVTLSQSTNPIDPAKDDSAPSESSISQIKRDSGYSYVRPSKFSFSQGNEQLVIRDRTVPKRYSIRTILPFERYGLPKQRNRPSSGLRNNPNNQGDLHIAIRDFTSGNSNVNIHQRVPSPIRDYDFVEPSPIAGQNNVPFNSNAANYLPPRNQKLPAPTGLRVFANHQQNLRAPSDHRGQPTGHHSSNLEQQSQSFIQGSFDRQPGISDAAIFLSQNSQAISQLYDAPATNLNYEPARDHQDSIDSVGNPLNGFQNFGADVGTTIGSVGPQDSPGFRGNIPSYASGILDQATLRDIQSLEKDRLISHLQRALVDTQSEREIASGGLRYAQNHENPDYVQPSSVLGIQGRINPSLGPQLDRPNGSDARRPYGTTLAVGSFLPPGSSTTVGYNYGSLSSTTPSTAGSATSTNSVTQTPNHVINGEASSQGNSISAPGASTTFQFPQLGGFVPSLIGTNYLAHYPTYATNILGSSTFDHSQSSSPTQFGIPIPTLPVAQATPGFIHNPSSAQKPDSPLPQQPNGTPVQPLPVQPIHPISANPVQASFPLVPAVTQIQSGSTTNLGHPAYGVQSLVPNHLLIKPIKPVYPLYYYPNVYQIQKPGIATLPWSYAPSYSQTRPAQAWK